MLIAIIATDLFNIYLFNVLTATDHKHTLKYFIRNTQPQKEGEEFYALKHAFVCLQVKCRGCLVTKSDKLLTTYSYAIFQFIQDFSN